eukprot:1138705-Pelagomonas_calceolata.AAC.1
MGFDLQPASLATRLAGQCQPHKTYPQLQKTEDREVPFKAPCIERKHGWGRAWSALLQNGVYWVLSHRLLLGTSSCISGLA